MPASFFFPENKYSAFPFKLRTATFIKCDQVDKIFGSFPEYLNLYYKFDLEGEGGGTMKLKKMWEKEKMSTHPFLAEMLEFQVVTLFK